MTWKGWGMLFPHLLFSLQFQVIAPQYSDQTLSTFCGGIIQDEQWYLEAQKFTFSPNQLLLEHAESIWANRM
ncbi:MAG: hypothetical protein VXZ72_01735, partial [Chlamydiota bacterium]|nr:hypothetical protein [Chlamydiota bacterium]